MATTAIVAEILIAGLEAAVWLMLFVLTIFGVDWVDLGAVKDWQALVTLLVVAAAYALGIPSTALLTQSCGGSSTCFREGQSTSPPGSHGCG